MLPMLKKELKTGMIGELSPFTKLIPLKAATYTDQTLDQLQDRKIRDAKEFRLPEEQHQMIQSWALG